MTATQTDPKPAAPAAKETALAKPKPFQPLAPVGSVGNFKQIMGQPWAKKMLQEAITKGLKPERLLSLVTTAMSRTPQLQQCTGESIVMSCVDAALAGCVKIGGENARGYIIPRKNGRLSREAGQDVYEAQFQSSYLGLCDMARRSGEIAFIDAFPVFEGDVFQYDQGFESKLIHKPNPSPTADRSKAKLQYVYAIARYRTHNQPQFRVLTMAEVEEHRARSMAKNNGPWVTDYIAMALKTAVRVLCKWLPQSPEMAEFMDREAEREVIDVSAVAPATLAPTDGRQPWGFDQQQAPAGETVDGETGEVQQAPETAAALKKQKEKLAATQDAPPISSPDAQHPEDYEPQEEPGASG